MFIFYEFRPFCIDNARGYLSKNMVLIAKVHSKGKRLILCGELNINFLQYSGKLQELQHLLLMNNLTNIVKSPTRITSHTKSLIDIVIVNYTNDEMFTEVLDLGYSDHLAQFLYIKSKNLLKDPITACKRHFIDNNVEEYKYLLHEETWAEVLAYDEPNTSFSLFMNTFTY